jgi:tetratricopeptide (TPR) repeat protein
LTGALRRFWRSRGYLAEDREWTSALLAMPEARARTAARAKALHAVGGFANQQGDYAEARARFEESLDIYREIGDTHGIGWGLVHLGILTRYEGNHLAARALLEECVEVVKSAGDTEVLARRRETSGWSRAIWATRIWRRAISTRAWPSGEGWETASAWAGR